VYEGRENREGFEKAGVLVTRQAAACMNEIDGG